MTGFTRRASLIDAFWDAIVRGEPRPGATGIPPEQADTVRWFQRLSTPVPDPHRDRAWSALEQRIRTEHLSEETHVMNNAYALAPPVRPAPLPAVPSPRALPPSRRSRTMTWLSAGLLIAVLGALAYGIFAYQDRSEPTLPAVVGSPSPESTSLGTDWGQFRGGVERTGYTTDPGPGGDLNLLWSFTADESLNGIMEAGGNVIAYGQEGGLYAIDALTGEQVWMVDLTQQVADDPGAVKLPAYSAGVIYVSTLDGDLVAVDASDGATRWKQHLASDSPSGPTVANRVVYVVLNGTQLVGLDAVTGQQTWGASLPSMVENQYPTIAEGKLFIADDTSQVHAIDLASGQLVWSSEPIAAHRVSAYMDGVLYVPGYDGRLTAISAEDGHVLWATEPSGGEGLKPIAMPSAIVATTGGDGVQGLDPKNGTALWTADPMVSTNHSPHAAGSYVYVHHDDGRYVALQLSDGSVAAMTDQAVAAGSTAAISGELLFVSGIEGVVSAFGPGSGTPAVSSAPIPAIGSPSPDRQATIEALVATGITADLVAVSTEAADFPEFTFFLADDGDGHLWTIDPSDGSVEKFDRDFNLLASWPFGLGNGPDQFNWDMVALNVSPTFEWSDVGMAFAPDGRVFVTDMGNARVQVIGPDGTLAEPLGTRGDADGQFQYPVDITRNGDEIAVVDFGRRDIQWFDLEGNFLRKLTGPQPGTQFLRPTEIDFDSEGNFWAVDTAAQQLLKFEKDGTLLFTIGGLPVSSSPGRFRDPSMISVDDQDRLWIADQWNQRIQLFDAHGNLLAIWDGCDTEADCFHQVGIVLPTGSGYLYVGDYDAGGIGPPRVMKFRITSMPDVPMLAAANPAAVPEATPGNG